MTFRATHTALPYPRHNRPALRALRAAACVLALSALLAPRAAAQVGESRRTISIGAGAGVAMNSVGFDPTVKQGLHIGPTFGIAARFTSEKYFSTYCALQLEVNLSQLGWRENVLNSQSEPLPDTYRRDIYYMQLPMLARLGWGRERKGLMGYFLAGPQIGWCVGEKTRQSAFTLNADGTPDRPSGTCEQYDLSVQRKFDYGITAGLGAELSTAAGHFLLEGRYYYGLSDIFDNAKKDPFGRSNNGTIVVKVTYLFDIRK